MYKAIVSDLDGTLFNENSLLSPYTVSVLLRAADAGLKVILATGRHHTDLQMIVEQTLGIPAYRISENGGVAFSPEGERLIYHPIAPQVARRLVKVAEQAPDEVYLHLYKGDRWFVNKHDAVSVTHQNQSGFMFRITDYAQWEDFEDCTKMCFMARNAASVAFMERAVREVVDPSLSFYWTMNTCFEAMDSRADKGAALTCILQREGIRPQEVIAFGDGLNDLNMLRTAGTGVVMGNAVAQLVEALPGHPVIGTNREDAVAHYLDSQVLRAFAH